MAGILDLKHLDFFLGLDKLTTQAGLEFLYSCFIKHDIFLPRCFRKLRDLVVGRN